MGIVVFWFTHSAVKRARKNAENLKRRVTPFAAVTTRSDSVGPLRTDPHFPFYAPPTIHEDEDPSRKLLSRLALCGWG